MGISLRNKHRDNTSRQETSRFFQICKKLSVVHAYCFQLIIFQRVCFISIVFVHQQIHDFFVNYPPFEDGWASSFNEQDLVFFLSERLEYLPEVIFSTCIGFLRSIGIKKPYIIIRNRIQQQNHSTYPRSLDHWV